VVVGIERAASSAPGAWSAYTSGQLDKTFQSVPAGQREKKKKRSVPSGRSFYTTAESDRDRLDQVSPARLVTRSPPGRFADGTLDHTSATAKRLRENCPGAPAAATGRQIRKFVVGEDT